MSEAAAMTSAWNVLRELFRPLNIAAYVTWFAVLVLLLDAPAQSFPGGSRLAALASMGVFLAAFVVKGNFAPGRAHWSDYPLLAVEGAAALGLCVAWHHSMTPVLTIVFIADCAMLLRAPALIIVGLALDAALWGIAVAIWETSQPWR